MKARDEKGSAAVELVGMIPWLFLAALVAWQLLMAALTAVSAENAARAGSRAASLGGDAEKAGRNALSSWLRNGATVDVAGTRVEITVLIPIVVPVFSSDDFAITRTAEIPKE